ncbi:MAG: ROK family protein [Bacteroidales bacterium]|nr:ROK family protein [Bacteroidales bacterium]
MDQKLAIGTDIGGSHISCAAVDLNTGIILKDTLSERAIDNQAQAFQIVSQWSSCLQATIDKVSSGVALTGIGFAMPGPFDYVNGIALFRGVPKYENLYGFNIADAIRSSLDLTNEVGLRFMNDASSFAIGESWSGKSADAERSVAITLGTGFGSAFIDKRVPVVDGPLVPKFGCMYHLPFGDSNADSYFSTRWFQAKYKLLTGREVSGVRELSEMAAGDTRVREIFNEFGRNLGIFLAPWLKGFGAEVLVIGGNISHTLNLFGTDLSKTLADDGCDTTISVSDLKEDAALIGSAYLFNEKFWSSVQHALPLM